MKNFEKQFDIRNTVEYVKKRMKWIAVIGVVCFGIVFATLYFGERERLGSTDTYTCSEMIVVIPEDHSGYTGKTCLEILLSREAIEPVAEELGLRYEYNSIFSMMDWKWGSNYFAYKVSLTSNTKEIDGYPLEVILGRIIENGMEIIKEEIEVSKMAVIDEPYYEITTKGEISLATVVISSLQYTALIVFFVIVALCCMCSANAKIGSVKDIETNFVIPVIGVWKRKNGDMTCAEKLAGMIQNNVGDDGKSLVYLGGLGGSNLATFAEKLVETLGILDNNITIKRVENLEDSIENICESLDADLQLICVNDLANSAYRANLAKKCDMCVLFMEKEVTVGREVMLIKQEFDEAGIAVKGAIFVE